MKKDLYNIVFLFVFVVLLVSCSTKKNTRVNRFYNALNSQYNIYYNGKLSFDEAFDAMLDSYQDDYSEMIHMLPVSAHPKDKEKEGGPFDRAIEKGNKAVKLHSIKTKPSKKRGWRNNPKQVALQAKEEYNPFLKQCWLLIGQAQFYNADFLQASATFSYIARHYKGEEDVVVTAKLWQARCYSELSLVYESEDILRKLNINGIPEAQSSLYANVYADLLIKNNQYEKAIPYLKTAMKAEKNRKQRARMKYLLGQLYADLGLNTLAYDAFGDVIKSNPPYELEFASRVRQTEVFAGTNEQKVIKTLKRMSCDKKNTNYIDQVYYALGNVYINKRDTTNAIKNYQKGIDENLENGLIKALCQVKLGDIYFNRKNYIKSQPYLSNALTALQKKHKEYERIAKLSSVLDELVTHIVAVHLQDSLQTLSRMPEVELLAAIPLTDDDIKASNVIIVNGLYNISKIYKDKLEDLNLSIKSFQALEQRFPGNEHLLESYYQIFLMALRLQDKALSNEYKSKLINDFPESSYTMAIANPDYEYNVRMMDNIQDSVYRATYQAYLDEDISMVRSNYKTVSEKYPLAKLMPQFMFLNALTYLQMGDSEGFRGSLQALLDKYPKTDVSELAGDILKGLLNGRTPMQGGISGMNWNLRFGVGDDGMLSPVGSTHVFTADTNTAYRIMLVYPTERVDKNRLLFAVAAYNFANFMVKEFDLNIEQSGPISILMIREFVNIEEAMQYYRMIHGKGGYANALNKDVVIIPIAEDNYKTLVNGKTFDEYITFFADNLKQYIPDLIERWRLCFEDMSK